MNRYAKPMKGSEPHELTTQELWELQTYRGLSPRPMLGSREAYWDPKYDAWNAEFVRSSSKQR